VDFVILGLLGWSVADVLNVVMVMLGLGLVIFIHELGHFAVAKWCGVKVERFSIGFGPVILKYTRGETEYALSLIPFGGYVKMLGQDDADPSQITDERLQRDPRSYTAKSVPQRMAIISAGVFNNMVTAVMFFMLAFLFGVTYEPAVIGNVAPGMPAWQAGLRMGDRIVRIGDRADDRMQFMDLRQTVALSHGPLEVEVIRDGQTVKTTVHPTTRNQLFPVIGAEPEQGTRLIDKLENGQKSPTADGSPASRATPAFEAGDLIVAVDGTPVTKYSDMAGEFARKRDKTLAITVRRMEKGGKPSEKTTDISVEPNRFRDLGLKMEIGKIAAIQEGSPAGKSDLRPGDKITHVIVEGRERPVGPDIDPLRLPDFLDKLVGTEVTIRAKREVPKGEPTTIEVKLVPEDRPSWVEKPFEVDSPLSIPSIGIAYHVLQQVVVVEPGSPADGKIRAGDTIVSARIFRNDAELGEARTVTFGEEERNWPAVFLGLSLRRDAKIELTIVSQGAKEERKAVLEPREVEDWYLPVRGIMVPLYTQIRKANGAADAMYLGWDHARTEVTRMYLMLRRLFSGRVSAKALGGPLSIFGTAHMFVKKGVADLILFLGMLSVSLAVLNFLPIPVLDGGHFVLLLWEGLTGKPPSEGIVLGAQYVGLLMILSLMVWVMYLDVSRFFFGM
jgi:regulator of sigma E protease